MIRNTVLMALGAVALGACTEFPTLLSGNNGGVLDSYFATNVGRQAGHAEAYAQMCPRLEFDEVELDLFRVAICQGLQRDDNCELPSLEAERQTSFDATLASLAGVPTAEICADAEAQAAENPILADYFGVH